MNARNWRWLTVVVGGAIPALLMAGIGGGGCTDDAYWYSCDDASPPTIDNKPCRDAGPITDLCDGGDDCDDAGTGAGGAGTGGGEEEGGGDGIGGGMSSLCVGQCVPREPPGWFEPLLLWMGPPDRAPDCPATAPVPGFELHADLVVEPYRCAACACDPPDASCEVPAPWSAVDSSTCPAGPGAQRTPFAAPEAWDGTCTTANAIPAGQACAGGPCAQSLDIPAPRVRAGACAPSVVEEPGEEPGEPQGGFRWATLARACAGVTPPAPCGGPGTRCSPAPPEGDAAPPGGFLTCILHHEGEHECPPTYPSRRVVYEGAEDSRGCTACTCGEPSGGACSVWVSAFSDAACSDGVVSVLMSSEASFCGAIAPGTALGSKSAAVVDLEPGSCTPGGGEPIGDVAPRGAVTFCCLDRQPQPPEPPRLWNPELG
ncbi:MULTISPECIES: hypothetical protein [Sorangium]|uniref:Uncharacterized protein n=1 Tax=Sorangium cellulosum TaxID=56 RepID=A0A4P2R5G8_SORCE|nr:MULTISPECIES: hypothetical protein [Sorangium]AUX38018.1 uncharacterized protein SOCE836_102560 [Sorangium cellulosum]WCQ97306.1 hypothetical protein NQZ70_10097 [Sorangium sp. Soce836]